MIKVPSGTKDVLPSERPIWNYVNSIINQACKSYGFTEIRTPIFEHTELFDRGVGDTTDVVEKQMYTFEDKGGRSLTLRPEGTAGVARSFIENGMSSLPQPVKMFYNMTIYRYEKKQKGRYREFTQFGAELYGSPEYMADTEVIALVDTILKKLGIRKVELVINSIGCPKCRPAYNKLLLEHFGNQKDKLCDVCLERLERNPLRVLDCKEEACKKAAEGVPLILDSLCDECAEHFENVKHTLDNIGIKYRVDPFIVRGLDYYSKTVFEFISTDIGSQGAVCAGGRYDGLVECLGGSAMPAVGFAMGIERILLHMESENLLADIAPDMPKLYIATMGEKARRYAEKLTFELRANGIWVETDLLNRSLKAQFKFADKRGAGHVLTVGDNELENGRATVKCMADGSLEECSLENAAEYFTKKFI